MGRSTSRGRPSKRSARSSSASRKVKPSKVSPVQKKQSPQALRRISKSPQKSTPKEKARKTRSSSRTRKVNTAPPAVSAKKKKEATGSRPSSPQSYTSIKTITLTTTRGPPRPATASPLLFTNTLRGSLSPPTLRSRTAASTTNNQRGLTHSPSLQPKKLLKGRNVYFEQFKNCAFSRQLGKVGNSIKKGTCSIANTAKSNWRILLLLFFLFLLIGTFYKFNKELLQLNKQFVEFVKEQYTQQRQIFG